MIGSSKYRAVFSSIDGALLNADNRIGSLTKEAVIRLQLHGIPFILVSGRSPKAIEQVDDEIGLTAPYICYNGALILNQNKQIIRSQGFLPKKAISIKNYITRCFPRVCLFACSYDTWITDDMNNPWILREASVVQSTPLIKPLSSYLQEEQCVHKLLCMGEAGDLNALKEDLRVCYPELSVFLTKKNYLEIMPGDVSVASAVKLICDLYKIDPKDTVAFGNSDGDIPLFQSVGLSIAMGNASDNAAYSADHVTLDNNHDGIYYSIKRIFPDLF